MKKLVICCAAALSLSGCSFAPEYVRPSLDLPSVWGENAALRPLEVQWWKRFNDPALNALVDEALNNNMDIEAAMARVDQARAALGLSRANQFPTVAGAGDGAHAQASRTGQQPIPSPINRDAYMWNGAVQAAWELDLWGKYRNSTAAAREQLFATEEAKRGVLLAVAAQTSVGYFTMRNFDLQLQIAERTLTTREEALAIYQARFDEGLINELDLLRAKTEVDSVRTTIYTTRYQIGLAESALQLLTGRSPKAIFEGIPQRGTSLTDLPQVPQMPAGMPSDLLLRRPDIAAAEAQLRAANFKIGVAKAEWFPSISLTGLLGTQSVDLSNMLKDASNVWSYGGSISVPILTFGRISNNVMLSEAQVREAAATYGKAVQTAFQEIRDAIVTQTNTALMTETLQSTVTTLTRAVDLARLRYENGYSSYLEVLDAERSLFQTELQLAEVRANHLKSIVNVCLALGGGWDDGQK